MNYPKSLGINYADDNEYRHMFCNLIRDFFILNSSDFPPSLIINTNEWNSESVKLFLDTIYSQTINNKTFLELYQFASANVMSTHSELGIVVLFSYCHFILFHECLSIYFDVKNQVQEIDIDQQLKTHPTFLLLKSRLL